MAKRARNDGAWGASAADARDLSTPYGRARAAALAPPRLAGAYDPVFASRVEPFDGAACGNGTLRAATHVVHGAVASFVYPAGAHRYDGAFAIVALRRSPQGPGATIKLDRPQKGERRAVSTLDFYHYYSFACAYEPPEKGRGARGTYRVLETLAVHALPFDRTLLAAMLCRELSMPRKQAADTALSLRAPPPGRSLDVEALHGVAPWFDELFEHCDYFHEEHLARLEATWQPEKLRLVARARLGELETALATRPLTLCFHWLSGFGDALPELDEAQLRAAAPRRYGAAAAPDALLELDAVRFYCDVLKSGFHAEGHMFATPYDATHGRAVAAFLARPELVALARRERMLAVVAHHGCPCVYAFGDLLTLRQLRDDMRAIVAAPCEAEQRAPPKRRQRRSKHDVELSEEQSAAVAQAVSTKFFAVLGQAGCGKTSVGRYIYRHYEEGEVLCLAFMGLTVSLLKKRVGAAMTMDKLVQRVGAAADRADARLAGAARRRRGAEQLAATVRAGDTLAGVPLGPVGAGAGANAGAGAGAGAGDAMTPLEALSISTDDGSARRLGAADEARAAEDADPAAKPKTLLRKLAPRVLLFDEMSQINFRRLAAVFAALRRNGGPQIERVVFLGDAAQCTSIDRGAFMPAYLQLYCNADATPYAPLFCSRLLANHRVSEESQLLLRNLERLQRGAVAELELSRDPASAHPFLVLRRPLTLEAAVALMAQFLVRDAPAVENQRDGDGDGEEQDAPAEMTDEERAQAVVAGAVQRAIARAERGPEPEPRTAQLLVQRDRERSAFNVLFLRRDAVAVQTLGADGVRGGHFCVGQRIMFLQNRDASPKREPPHMRSNGVKNGIIAYVTRIEDVCVDTSARPVPVEHTGAPPTRFGGREARRMLHFVVEGDERKKARRISLHNYALANLTLVDAMTIAKMQGCEADTIVIYIHPDLSWTFSMSDLLVAISRARRRVVIVCSEEPRPEFGGRSELEMITQQRNAVRYEYLEDFMPTARDLVRLYRPGALTATDRAALRNENTG